MNRVFVAASLAALLALAAPALVAAQERERAPRPAATPTVEPSPSESAPRDVAVPRSTPRAETPRADTPRADTARSEAPPRAASDDQERRGAVRRPPSDGGRGSNAGAPRDRAVARTGPPPRDRDRDWNRDWDRDRYRVYYYPSYYSYGRYYDPYYYGGFHVGYLAYSPWGWTPAFYGYPYGYGPGPGPGYGYGYDFGRLRIKVQPRDAEVYVDGYYAGTVDDFDGVFQSLRLETGGYRVEVRKPGFETLQFDVHVQPDRTITYRGAMRPTP